MNIPGLSRSESLGDELLAGFRALRDDDQRRLLRYRDAEDRYERSRDRDSTYVGEDDDYGLRKGGDNTPRRHRIPLNYEHAITQKHTFRIAGRPPDILVPGNDRSPRERFRSDTIEKMLYGVYRYSDSDAQFASGAHHASLLGASCFDVWMRPDGPQMPYFRELHPGTLLVVPGIDRLHDYECAYRFWTVSLHSVRAKYGDIELPFGDSIDAIKPDEPGGTRVTIVEKITRTQRIRFAGRVVLSTFDHNYGFVPIVVIPNLGPVERFWGYSDWEFYKDAVEYFERLVSRQADVARGTAGGAMQGFGTGQDSRKLLNIIRNGGFVEVKKESKGIAPIETPQFGAWHDAHFQYMRSAINDLSFSPDAAWGTIGAATSGSDRALQLGPQLELTGLKQVHWAGGLKRLNTMILRLIEANTTEKTTFRGSTTKGHRTSPFTLVVNALTAEMESEDAFDAFDPKTGAPMEIPQTPRDLIDGDYCTEIVWQNRLDRDDPQFVLTELNKYAQALQSAYTTLERLGFPDPEEELRLIQKEAKEMPWLRQGMIALVNAQVDAQKPNNSGEQSVAGGDLSGGLATLMAGGGGAQGGALNKDALARGLNGSDNAGGQTPGRVPGAYTGGA